MLVSPLENTVLLTTLRRHSRVAALIAVSASLALGLAACGDNAEGSSGDGGDVKVTLILKDLVNPFFVSLQKGAEAQAEKDGVDLTIAAGDKDGDEASQISAIESAVAAGQDGILVLPSGPGVYSAIESARDAGLVVIALDTPTDPADTVDTTFATDNFEAGQLIGQWAAQHFAGEDVTIAMLDQFDDRVIQTDLNRNQGFLDGMGIDIADKTQFRDEDSSGTYEGGGSYTIACNEPTTGAEDGGRTAMETCLTQDDSINLVYTINEPAAAGAYAALEAAGLEDDVTIVSIDGSCTGVQLVADGVLGATSQQYPGVMAEKGVETIADMVGGGSAPANSDGLEFVNTGTALVTDEAFDGLESVDTAEGSTLCWG